MSESLFCYMSQSKSLSFLQVIVYIAKFTACACGVIIFYFLNRLAIAYGSMRYRPTLFGKFVAGIVGMIISAGLSLAGYHTSKWEALYRSIALKLPYPKDFILYKNPVTHLTFYRKQSH